MMASCKWCGTLSVVGAFALAGITGGLRAYQLLFDLAEAVARSNGATPSARPTAPRERGGLLTMVLFNVGRSQSDVLGAEDTFRVGMLARIALVVILFTMAQAFWSFDAFG